MRKPTISCQLIVTITFTLYNLIEVFDTFLDAVAMNVYHQVQMTHCGTLNHESMPIEHFHRAL